MPQIVAFYGSPRKNGNTSRLLKKAVEGAATAGGAVQEIVLSDLEIAPCLELYGCKTDGRCIIQDDFQQVYDQIVAADGIMLASPIFFYAVSAHTKILMDRCQSLWVKKHWINQVRRGVNNLTRKGLFISAGASRGKNLFTGALLSMRYFLEAIDTQLWGKLLYRGLDFEDDILKHPAYLKDAFDTGKAFCRAIGNSKNA